MSYSSWTEKSVNLFSHNFQSPPAGLNMLNEGDLLQLFYRTVKWSEILPGIYACAHSFFHILLVDSEIIFSLHSSVFLKKTNQNPPNQTQTNLHAVEECTPNQFLEGSWFWFQVCCSFGGGTGTVRKLSFWLNFTTREMGIIFILNASFSIPNIKTALQVISVFNSEC